MFGNTFGDKVWWKIFNAHFTQNLSHDQIFHAPLTQNPSHDNKGVVRLNKTNPNDWQLKSCETLEKGLPLFVQLFVVALNIY